MTKKRAQRWQKNQELVYWRVQCWRVAAGTCVYSKPVWWSNCDAVYEQYVWADNAVDHTQPPKDDNDEPDFEVPKSTSPVGQIM